MASPVLSPVKRQVDYPSSDGEPVAESDVHISCLLHTREDLKLYFGDRPDVYVAGNLLIYYEENNVKARVAPDVFVVMGVASHDRTSYLLWEEGKAPGFVLEITSRGTRKEDQGRKRELYGRLGVTEYWQYDPRGEWAGAAVTGHGADRRGVRGVAGTGAGGRDAGDDEHGAGTGAPQRSERVALPRSGDGAEHPDAGGDGSGVGAGRATP